MDLGVQHGKKDIAVTRDEIKIPMAGAMPVEVVRRGGTRWPGGGRHRHATFGWLSLLFRLISRAGFSPFTKDHRGTEHFMEL